MSFAKVIDTSITKLATRLPETAQRLDNDAWVLALRTADVATQEACGWHVVVEETRPADPDYLTTYSSSVALVDGVPTRTWTERPKRDSELYPSAEAAAKVTAELAAQKAVADDVATREQISAMAGLFPTWSPDAVAYGIGAVVKYAGMTAKCVQAHTSQADWEPTDTPALWTMYRPWGVALPWVQPLGAHDAYVIGERVTYNDSTWTSTLDANVWAPGVAGWDEDVELELP